ncbi:MAG: SDR family NAD(P)-dependent oxidoreductase [bacterium]|nr:SDR family NAD(P)-dependent oxidoreductase [bacterium]
MMNGKTVLITGSGGGIGLEMARFFYTAGCSLVLVSLLQEELDAAKSEFPELFPEQKIFIIQKDLSHRGSAKYIYDYCESNDIEVDILINNAGFGLYGEHLDISTEKISNMLMLNIVTVTELCHYFGNKFKAMGQGVILNTSSTASFQPVPFLASYAASKAYVSSFTHALARELKPYKVRVSMLCPGTTKTAFLKTAGIEKTGDKTSLGSIAHFFQAEPEQVARTGFNGLLKNRLRIIPGIVNKFQFILVSIIPSGLITFFVHMVFKRGYTKK